MRSGAVLAREKAEKGPRRFDGELECSGLVDRIRRRERVTGRKAETCMRIVVVAFDGSHVIFISLLIRVHACT